jgi:hypothetical protein
MVINSCESGQNSELELSELLNDLTQLPVEHPNLSIAATFNRDTFLSEDELNFYRDKKQDSWDYIFETSKNLAGYSRDVHGQLNVIRSTDGYLG